MTQILAGHRYQSGSAHVSDGLRVWHHPGRHPFQKRTWPATTRRRLLSFAGRRRRRHGFWGLQRICLDLRRGVKRNRINKRSRPGRLLCAPVRADLFIRAGIRPALVNRGSRDLRTCSPCGCSARGQLAPRHSLRSQCCCCASRLLFRFRRGHSTTSRYTLCSFT